MNLETTALSQGTGPPVQKSHTAGRDTTLLPQDMPKAGAGSGCQYNASYCVYATTTQMSWPQRPSLWPALGWQPLATAATAAQVGHGNLHSPGECKQHPLVFPVLCCNGYHPTPATTTYIARAAAEKVQFRGCPAKTTVGECR